MKFINLFLIIFAIIGDYTYRNYNQTSTSLYDTNTTPIKNEINKECEKFYGQEILTIEITDSVKRRFEPITEMQYESFKADNAGTIYDMEVAIMSDCDTFTIYTLDKCFEFESVWINTNYRNIGFMPEINSYGFMSYGTDVMWVYLIDRETNEFVTFPSNFDASVLGILISPNKKYMLWYTSHYDSDYADYYDWRAEILFCEIGNDSGLERFKKTTICKSNSWSIQEIVWIDNNSIALKVYEIENHERVYSYCKTKII